MGSSKTVKVSVRECRHVRSPRSDTPQCFVRVEQGTRVLSEGGKVMCDGVMSGGVEVTLECDPSHRQSVDELIQNPILVSLLEVLPKDKKSKDERTAELGHMIVDLLPLLLGERSIQLTRTLQGGEGGEGKAAEVDVVVRASEGILTEEQQAESNVMFLRVRSLHSLPSSWSTSSTSPSSHFTLSTPHPLSGPPLSLTGAQMKRVESEGDHTHWKWPAVRCEGVKSERWAVEDESGEFRGHKDVPFRRSAECEELCVDWSTELRTWLPPSPSSSSSPPPLLTTLTQSPMWPVEVVKSTTAQVGKGKGKEEDTLTSHHGVAYLDLSPLLYPGTTLMAGAYSLHPFSEADVVSKTRRDYRSLLAGPSSPGLMARKTLLGGGGKSNRKLNSALKLRSGSIVSQASEDHEEGERHAPQQQDDEKRETREGVVYEQARSYLWVELELHHPLVPKRPASILAEKVSEYVPRRPAMRRVVGGADKALRAFHHQTSAITHTLLGEYRDMFGGEGGKEDSSMEDRHRQMLYHLNSTGKYHTLKEQLKHAVVGVVRERYGNRNGFPDSAHRHAFLSHLYTYLTDQLHANMNQTISLEDPPEATPTPVDCELLKHFAHEAEDFQDYALAEKYYQERVSCADHVAQYWYDYGVFCLLIGRLDKAEQCLKEAVALDQKMIPALLLYGMLNCIGERYEEGSEFMELATTSDPNNIATWAIRGLFYEQQGNRVMEEMCYEEAVRLSRGQSEKTFLTSYRMQGPAGGGEEGGKTPSKPGKGESEDLLKPDTLIKEDSTTMTSSDEPAEPQAPIVMVDNSDDPNTSKVEVQLGAPPTTEPVPPCGEGEVGGREDPRASVFLQTASFLLDVHALKYAEMSLSHVLASPSPPPSLYHIQEARLHLHKAQPREALTCLKASLQLDVQNSWAWSLLGHAHFLLGEFPLARAAYERTLLLQTPPPNLHSVFLHLAHIHLSDKKYSSARDVYLRACRNTPSGATWRGVGVACYKLGDLGEAEAALSEANVLNNHDPLIWAYLTLVCLKTGRPVEAEQALKFAVKTGLRTELDVVQEIRQEMMSHQQDPAHQHIPHLLTQLT